jgi:NAD(P)-dependent dehydrogenase (short-subunit alcohol dehydrogenase family)
MQLENVTAVVSGGASGLGLATVRELLEKGALVTVLDLPGTWTPELSAGLAERYGDRVRFAAADVTDEEDVRRAIGSARETGPLRALVHCAGRGSDRLRIVDRENQPGELASFVSVVTINLVGTYNVLRLAAAAMSGNEPVYGSRGACVLTASVAAFDGQIGQTSYAASKAGVHGMTLVAARDLASHGIRVNTVAPGTFDTPMLARLRDDLRDKLASEVPFPKRLGNPCEFGRLAVSVLENDYLNGETIRLDGAIRMAPR